MEAHVALPEEGDLSRALSAAGATIHLFRMDKRLRKLSRWEIARRPQVAVSVLLEAIRTIGDISKIARRVDPDVIHTNSMKAHLLGSVPARWRGVPLVWHVRDILRPGWLRSAFGLIAGHAPMRVLCISRAVQAQFDGTAGASRTALVYNGIDVARFAARSEEGFRTRMGIPKQRRVVGTVGQIAHWKGQDVFLRAAAEVAPEAEDVTFVVVGECLFPENEGAFEQSLHAMVDDLGLSDRVMFAGWQDDPAEVMAGLDVFVHTSRLPEPFGRVVIEGMSAGCCVIASAEGAGPELLEEGEGLVIEPDDPHALATAMRALLAQPDPAAMKQAARAGAARFDISRTASAVASVYSDILPGRA